MKKLYSLALLLCLYSFGLSQLDCSTFTVKDAKETALFLYLPDYQGCASTPTYDISYRPASGGPWTSVNPFYHPSSSAPESFFFFGLTACTDYDVRVQVYCNGTFVGECIETFSTDGCDELNCDDVNVAHVGTTTADIVLTNQSGCADPSTGDIIYELRLKEGSNAWGAWNTNLTQGTISLTGLLACTDYEYEIRLYCNGAPTTICAGRFTTECGTCNGITATNIGDNSADITLNGFDDCRDGTTLGYDLRYREQGGVWVVLTGLTTNGAVHALTGLTACTVYEYEVTIKCNGEEVTCSGSFNTTGCTVYPCSGVTIPYVNDNLAYVQFTGFEDCELSWGGYTVKWELYNHTTGQWTFGNHNLGQNYFVLQGLDPCTEYTVYLAIKCKGIYTEFCAVTFETTGDCLTSGGGSGNEAVGSGGEGRKMQSFAGPEVTAYPNPFGQQLSLEFGMQTRSEVAVVLTDMLGREVYRNVNTYGAGLHRLDIDGNDLPAGLLFYTLTTGSETLTGRVVKQ